jgi:NADH dehydrogenase
MPTGRLAKVLILGGGYAGLMTARALQRDSVHPVDVTVVDPNPYMTYQSLLPEVAGGHVAPPDVAVSLRRVLARCRVIQGSVLSVDSARKVARVRKIDHSEVDLGWDHVVIAMGAIARVFPTPGLEENAIGFKTIEEAVFLHNHVIDQVALAANTDDPAERRRALTFVVVGAGYTGVEALFELLNLSRTAVREHPDLAVTELRWVLIEALDRVAPEVGPTLSRWTLGHLRKAGVDVRLTTTVSSCVDGVVVLSTGESFPANTIVWTAGVKPNPVLDATDLPRGPKGHVVADVGLRVVREDGCPVEGVWAVGDIAQIPDLTAAEQPAYYPPNAQNAMRQGPVAARNILATIVGAGLEEYRHSSLGTVASFGMGSGAANILGFELRGLPAWLAHRGYHILVLPTLRLRVRVLMGWVTEVFSGPEVVSLRAVRHPKRLFRLSFATHPRTAVAGDRATTERVDERAKAADADDDLQNPPLPDWGPRDGYHGTDREAAAE